MKMSTTVSVSVLGFTPSAYNVKYEQYYLLHHLRNKSFASSVTAAGSFFSGDNRPNLANLK
jgi:hypothetical protein